MKKLFESLLSLSLSLPLSLSFPLIILTLFSDVKTVNLELGETMRKHRKGSDFGAGLDRNRSLLAEIEEKTVTLGRKTRTEVSEYKLT